MKNLSDVEPEKLDDFPTRLSRKEYCAARECHCEFRDRGYNWGRLTKWLHSREGLPWDHVISDFIWLEWIPTQYRTYRELCRHVEVHTFLKDGEVYCYPNFGAGEETKIGDEYRACCYVHPTTRLLCFKSQTTRLS
jgi:hypothetical protein